MAALTKARDISAYLAKPHFNQKVILLYGPDQGLVTERADFIARQSGVDLSDPFCLIRLDADDAAADAARLADEAHTIGMFGGSRLIRVSGTTRRDLGKSIKPLLQTPPEDAIVLIEGGDLKRNSGLLNQLSKSPNALCIACYQDLGAALEQLIDEEISGKGLKIDRDTRSYVKSLLGENRMVSRGELSKLALYCEGRDSVTMEDVRSIMGDASKLVMDDLIDAVSVGNPTRLQEVLPKAIEAGNSADMITWAVMRHFQFLHLARSKVEQKRQTASTVIDGARPPIHFSRKDAVKRALNIWPMDRIGRALTRLDATFFECRQKADAAPSLTGTTLLALCLEAQVLGRRR
ncbi:MAG: DNA polymerase III subunit delta [Rhizobiaceae bacterium]|nr:DNA polymerase III subunit delta [Rhizobiaceae bacterium]